MRNGCWALVYASEGGEERAESVAEAAIAERVVAILDRNSAHRSVSLAAIRVLGTLATGPDHHRSLVLRAGFLPVLGEVLHKGSKDVEKVCGGLRASPGVWCSRDHSDATPSPALSGSALGHRHHP